MNANIRNGKNDWVNFDGKKVKSAANPDASEYGPAYPPSRVHGSEYTPYENATTEWEKAANKAMASAAQSNFATRR